MARINPTGTPAPANDDPEASDATRLPGFLKMRDVTDVAPTCIDPLAFWQMDTRRFS